MSFHEVRFPTAIALASSGGPERRTEIVVLGSGHEERNTRWAHSRRRYNAGYGVNNIARLHEVIEFFEERRGRLYGFRWKDRADWKSSLPDADISPGDQSIGTGDGSTATFQLVRQYGSLHAPYSRKISKPVDGTVLVSVAGVIQAAGIDYTCDPTSGIVTFDAGAIPAAGLAITAGFEFDVPVRFDTDNLRVNLSRFEAGEIPDIPIVEVRL